MAHVKVVRRSMRPEEWTALRFGWLKRGIYGEQAEITDLWIRDARQISENGYEYQDGGERPLRRGDLYFTPDGSAFIRGTAVVPASFRGRRVHLVWKTAAEMIVKVNGRWAGGIDPNRERIDITPYLDGDSVSLEIEAYNRSKPDDERNPEVMKVRGCRQVFEGAYLALVREDVQSLVYDYTLLMDIAQSEYFNEDLRRFLFRELSEALNLVDFDTFEGVDRAAAYVEEHIYRNTDFGGTGSVALVGHSHLDIAYYWRRIHAVQKNARTVLIQLRLLEKYPEFRYTHTQAYTYETLEKYYPEIFAELKEQVRQGRFEPVGAMYVEPDCNIPAPESLIRQLLYGQSYFRKAFGITVDNAWLPDVFGNSWVMPQILKKCGVDYFVSNKMSTWNDTNRFPHNNFIWKGLDGSRVYACVPPTHFITWNMPSQIQENWEAYQDKETGGQTLNMFGYGDGGSGATEEMLELFRRFRKLSCLPKTEMTGGAAFLHRNLKDNPSLAVWDGELYLEMHRGTFTTKADIKKANRELEIALRETELCRALLSLAGVPYPAGELREAYKRLLLNQFHDILPGSHIHPVYEDAMADYAWIRAQAEALMAPAGREGLFNSLNFARTCPVFAPDPDGPFTRKGVRGRWFRPEGGGLGPVRLRPLEGDGSAFADEAAGDGTLCVTTPLYRVTFAPDGSILSMTDRELDQEWVREGRAFNTLRVYEDHPGVYDAWDILPNYRDIPVPVRVEEPLALSACDGSAAEYTCVLSVGQSRWTRKIRLFAASRAVEVENLVHWQEKHRLAKVNFAPDVLTREVVCDLGAGYIRREWTKNTTWQEARFEVCHHKWADLSEPGGGLALINENKYGLGLEEDEVSLSLLRSTIRPDITSDMGDHDFCYLIVPHPGDFVSAGVNRQALEYNVPLTAGTVPVPEILRRALCGTGLVLQALKIAEDGKGIVVRLSEQDGKRGRLRLPFEAGILNMLEDREGSAREIRYHPFEILTLSVDPGALAGASG